MNTINARSFLNALAKRRVDLGMSYTDVSRRSGVPLPACRSILTGKFRDPSFPKVSAIAEALGLPLVPQETPARKLREEQARKKAKRIAQMVQATSALEAQAVSADTMQEMEEQTMHELLAGPRRNLWRE